MSDLITLPPVDAPKANIAAASSTLQSAKNKADVHKAAQKFEAMFMQEMMAHMFEGMDTDGPFGGGHGEEMFRSMMIEQYGQKIAASGQIGLSKTLETEMLRLQEEQQRGGRPATH